MRLLLDEMHSDAAAQALRADGFDVTAVSEISELRGRSDGDVLAYAASHGRAVVTESVRHFIPLAQEWAAGSRPHGGIALTVPTRFNRANKAYPGTLVVALRGLLSASPVHGPSWVWWL